MFKNKKEAGVTDQNKGVEGAEKVIEREVGNSRSHKASVATVRICSLTGRMWKDIAGF